MKEVLNFLTGLKSNNNREWFNAHKEEYLLIKGKIENLTAALIAGISSFDPEARMLQPSDCLYRIYRDTRFSPDKTPYKTHIGIYVCPPFGKKSDRAGYYLHIEPGNSLIAGGVWCPDAARLKRIRTDIYDNVEEYLEIIDNPEFHRYFPEVGEDLLKTAPKDFPKDWEYVSLLRPRSFTCYTPLSDKEICSRDLLSSILPIMELLKPFNDFLNYEE